ncbi:hypothetical protein [Massilia sp.]|uniref:hypothetical protein n=1 Tax=Massilia sp. TaxID=1882437 RepID=UPI0028978B1A|nr:hypothetical protein [Massilia sp.]
MRALLCLAFASSTAFAAAPMDLGAAMDLKRDVVGQYRLDSGLAVRLQLIDDELYLDLNRRYRKHLLPVEENLVSRDGNVTVEYFPDGPVERILIRHERLPSRLPLGERSWLGK